MTRKPTDNGEAYLAFVQANNLHRELDEPEKLKQAALLYERALRLDPRFALAEAKLSTLESWFYKTEPTETRRESARRHADLALALQPDLPEAHFARGYYLYYGERNYDGALAEFSIAHRGMPNDAEAFLLIGNPTPAGTLGGVDREYGKSRELESEGCLVIAEPELSITKWRDFAAANRTLDRALAISPKSFSLWQIKSKLAIAERGDFSVAREALAALKSAIASGDLKPDAAYGISTKLALGQMELLLMERKYAEALSVRTGNQNGKIDLDGEELVHRFLIRLFEGVAHQNLGQVAEARAAFLKAKETAEAALREAPNEHSRHANLALALACLGEKDAAIAEAKRATELLPESIDAFEGPKMTTELAKVYAIVGEKEKAIELLDGLLSRPSDVTVALLKVDPAADPIRNDPAFQQLLAKHAR